MKFVSILFAASLAAICYAHCGPTRPSVWQYDGICSPQEALRITSCGCYISRFASPSHEIHEMCRTITRSNSSSLQSFCEPFHYGNTTSYDIQEIINSIKALNDTCFGDIAIEINGLYDQYARKFVLLDKAHQFFFLFHFWYNSLGSP